MRTHAASIAAAAAWALASLSPHLAAADSPLREGGIVHVEQSYVRGAYGGCRYIGTLRGDITVAPRSAGSSRYRPDVVVEGRIACNDGFEQRIEPHRVTGDAMTRSQVERALEEAGRIDARHGVQVCTMRPDFDWHDGTIRPASNFSEFCRYARGGGPRYHWFYSY